MDGQTTPCAHCGAPLRGGRFCTNCGAPIDATPVEPSYDEAPTNERLYAVPDEPATRGSRACGRRARPPAAALPRRGVPAAATRAAGVRRAPAARAGATSAPLAGDRPLGRRGRRAGRRARPRRVPAPERRWGRQPVRLLVAAPDPEEPPLHVDRPVVDPDLVGAHVGYDVHRLPHRRGRAGGRERPGPRPGRRRLRRPDGHLRRAQHGRRRTSRPAGARRATPRAWSSPSGSTSRPGSPRSGWSTATRRPRSSVAAPTTGTAATDASWPSSGSSTTARR